MRVNATTRTVLTILRAAGPVTTAEATRLLGRSSPQSASATLSTLARRGLVAKRASLWEVTSTGATHVTQGVEVARVAASDNTYRAVITALTHEPQTTAQVAAAAGLERTNTHKRLERLASDGAIVRLAGRPVRWRRA